MSRRRGLILRTYLDETRGDLMAAIGNYHSHTPLLNQGYQTKVRQSAATMFALRPAISRPAVVATR